MAQNVAAPNPLDVRLMHASANLMFVLVVCVVLGFGVRGLAKSDGFTIRNVRVAGDTQHNNAATLRANALPRLQGTYLTMDLRQARAIFEAVPWVKQAVVRRVWPHTLVVELTEHRPVAFWERDEGEDHLVDSEGEVFEVNLGDVEDTGFPTLRGPRDSAPQVLSMYRRLRPVIEGLGGTIDRLALSERGSWRVELERGTVIELGRGTEDEVVTRTRRFASTVTKVIANWGGARPVETVDLRYPDGYALKLSGVSVDISPPAGKVEAKPDVRADVKAHAKTNNPPAPGPGKGR